MPSRVAPVALVLLAASLAPLALADERSADCEAGQWWPGYRGTRAAQQAVEPVVASAGASLCQGEQWDGQDGVDEGTVPSGPACDATRACLGWDPNAAPGEDPFAPAAARVSLATGGGAWEAYAAGNVAFVGRAALYVGACGGGGGLEGEAACRGSREGRAGAYWRDNTPGNLVTRLGPSCLASVIPACGFESDCAYETWEEAQREGDRTRCGRDNDAVGAMLVLP